MYCILLKQKKKKPVIGSYFSNKENIIFITILVKASLKCLNIYIDIPMYIKYNI